MIDDDDWLADDDDAEKKPKKTARQPQRSAKAEQKRGSDGQGDNEPAFDSVYAFVEEHLVYVYVRDVITDPEFRWCPQYMDHPEVMDRFEALWRAYEQLRQDPGTGMSTWWIEHADRQMAVIFHEKGPFAGCSVERGHHPPLDKLPVTRMEDEILRQLMAGDTPTTPE
ncbi:DUF4913 domain-containing protein [Williamsia sterculiae]|uniref:DUF4913 domain-containing protein n=1 Tax=Williamsia sterculiae TaxID=1344003 RepID=A0A1N7HEN3_9NOCA|nr:DUF4913 domain-containing protein [Williamsia sterculiae]SIS23201.1 protein of unknown function [Williamsia sterculiae]